MAPTLQNILVPVDFSDHSNRALDYACSLARHNGEPQTRVHLLHVISDRPGSTSREEQIRDRLEQLGQSLDPDEELNLTTIKSVQPGAPYTVIINYAREQDIDMIVMGTHGRSGLSHFALGSVAERVVRSAPCPVLVMGPRELEKQVSLHRAADVLSAQFGPSLSKPRQEGFDEMREMLEKTFSIPSNAAKRLMDSLILSEWLKWEDGEPGLWQIIEGVEFIEDATPVKSAPPESQAADLIDRARRLRATDIHIDPCEANEVVIRLRIDGKLEEYCRLNELVGEHLQNQFKTMADLNIAEPFLPQEGTLRLPDSLSDLEVRITCARVAAGDAVALRIFDGRNIFLPLSNLGLSDNGLSSVTEMLRLGEGLVLITGPTGSGKSTTVYSMLESLGGIDRNVVSIEDPVEFAVPFVRQMNVDSRHNITMTSGLRTILRMDPDVVFLGEIRDVEAAHIAMRAASSGKYVLTTLHTRDVASTITALRDMDISDRSTAGNVTGIINQRLLRRLCPNCRKTEPASDKQRDAFAAEGLPTPESLYVPVGCSLCRETGFRGRIGVFEVALINDNLAQAIDRGTGERHLKELIRNEGVHSLKYDAYSKAAAGITSFNEARSVHWLE